MKQRFRHCMEVSFNFIVGKYCGIKFLQTHYNSPEQCQRANGSTEKSQCFLHRNQVNLAVCIKKETFIPRLLCMHKKRKSFRNRIKESHKGKQTSKLK